MRNIAIFASGSGSNAENIIKYFSNRKTAKVVGVYSNRIDAYVLQRAERLGVQSYFFDRNDFYISSRVIDLLDGQKVDFIVLAGFLWLVPPSLTSRYSRRIVNIHPALLPSYGGKGMYGARVHTAVIKNKEKESGITIHFVNENYDEGDIIFQAKCSISDNDTPESLAHKIHELEYNHFPRVIEETLIRTLVP